MATRTKQPAKKKAADKKPSNNTGEEETPRYGLHAAQAQMSGGGSRYPWLKLGDGDIARFHFLTNGIDPNMVGTRFHRFGQGRETRYYLCLRVYTGNQEPCKWCEQGHDQTNARFACWIYVHNILHASGAGQPDDVEWKTTKVGKKTLFREEVKKPFLWKSAAGMKQKWFNMVMNAYNVSDDLQLSLYELYREGVELETEYEMTIPKGGEGKAISKKILDSEEVSELPTVEDILREEATYGPSADGSGGSGGGMGSDEVMGEEGDGDIPTEAEPSEGDAEPEPDDSLI